MTHAWPDPTDRENYPKDDPTVRLTAHVPETQRGDLDVMLGNIYREHKVRLTISEVFGAVLWFMMEEYTKNGVNSWLYARLIEPRKRKAS